MEKPVSILYIVRHGECLNNKTRIILPPDEDVLTEQGKVQAGLLGEHLKDVKFTLAFSSDYARGVQTMRYILAQSAHPDVVNLKIQLDQRLRERDCGIYERGSVKDVLEFLAENIFDKGIPPTEVEFPEGDSTEFTHKEAESFFQDVFDHVDKSEKGETILATSHGYRILFLAKYLQSSPDKIKLTNSTDILSKIAPNTGVIKLAIHGQAPKIGYRKIQVLAEHDSKHLESLRTSDVLHEYSKKTRFDGCIHQ